MAVFAGFLISVSNLSVLFILASILFILASFKYFNQILLLLIFYVPFQVALNVTAGIDLASGRVLILYLFAVWVLKSLSEKRFVIKLNLQTLLISLFLVLAVFSMLQAGDAERAIRKILVFLSIFPLYFILTSFSLPSLCKEGLGVVEKEKSQASLCKEGQVAAVSKDSYIYKIVKMLLFGGFAISLIGIVQFVCQFIFGIDLVMEFWSKYIAFLFYGQTFGAEVLSNPSWLVNVSGATVLRAISLFPDPHMFSFYLGLIIPIAFSLVLFNNKKCHSELNSESDTDKGLNNFQLFKQNMWKIVRHCGFRKKILNQVQDDKCVIFNHKFLYIVLFVMFLAEFFTFSRGGYIGMIAGIGILIVLSWKYLNSLKKITIGLIFSLFLFVILFTNQSIVHRFISAFNFSEGSNVERIKNWNQGWEVFSDNLLTGVGIGNYSIYLYPTIEYRTPVYAHNLYLDIGAEMGVFALVVWLLLIVVTIWQLYRVSRKAKNELQRALALGLIGSLVWFSAHSFFDTSIYSPTILAVFVIILSLASKIISESAYYKKIDL